MLRMIGKLGARLKREVLVYEGNLNINELIYLINIMEKCFYCEEIDAIKKIEFVYHKGERACNLVVG